MTQYIQIASLSHNDISRQTLLNECNQRSVRSLLSILFVYCYFHTNIPMFALTSSLLVVKVSWQYIYISIFYDSK